MRVLPQRPFLYPITDRRLAGGQSLHTIMTALCAGGAKLIQMREKNLSTRELCALAAEATDAAHAAGAMLLVNDRADVALYAGADGVHLGDDEIPAGAARRILGDDAIIGVSCHSIEDVRAASHLPLNYIAVGPVYPTTTKQMRYPVVGEELVRRARAETDLPLVAIGGIGPEHAKKLCRAGADGLAVIGALMARGDIVSKTREFIAALASCGSGSET